MAKHDYTKHWAKVRAAYLLRRWANRLDPPTFYIW